MKLEKILGYFDQFPPYLIQRVEDVFRYGRGYGLKLRDECRPIGRVQIGALVEEIVAEYRSGQG